jgi:hypothetical protein
MKNAFLTAVVTAVVLSIIGMLTLAITGCATVNFYSNPGLTEKTGLKFYTVKPYLQVERETQTNTISKASIVYLPDLAHPQYLSVKEGLGSKKLDLKLAEGSISTLGISTETNIPESIEALAAMVDKSAEAVKDIAIKGVPPGVGQNTVTELYEIIMENNTTTVRKIDIK